MCNAHGHVTQRVRIKFLNEKQDKYKNVEKGQKQFIDIQHNRWKAMMDSGRDPREGISERRLTIGKTVTCMFYAC